MGIHLEHNTIKTNAALSVVKQLLSVIFPMITFPYATRIMGSANYGKYTFSLSIVNYISYIAAAGILRYAVRECARIREDRKNLASLVDEIFTINIITTVIAYVILLGLILFIPMLKEYMPLIMVISLSVIFTTLGTDWINSAFEEYFYITVRYIITQSMAVLLLFVLVRDTNDIVQYAIVSVFGGVLANILNIFHIRRKFGVYPKIRLSRDLLKHVKPILYLFACSIASFIYINSDITILRIYTDDKSVGLYAVSAQFYQLVKQLINAAFIVVIPRISNELATDEKKAVERYNNIIVITILLLAPCSIGLFMIRKNLILLFSGIEYIRAESSLAILAVAFIPAMMANFYVNIVMIPNKMEKQVMVATVISALINIGLNFVLIPRYAENAAAATTLIAEIAMAIIAMRNCKKIKMTGVSKPILAGAIGGLPIIVICYLFNRMIVKPLINIILCVSLSVIVYSIVVFLFYRKEVKMKLAMRSSVCGQ